MTRNLFAVRLFLAAAMAPKAEQKQDLDKTANDQPQEPNLKGESPIGS